MEKNNFSLPVMEILETRPLSDLVQSATVKVCWVSNTDPNPNNTLITESVGREIAATLPGAPVVGFYDGNNKDFEQHSRTIKFEAGEVIFEDITKPYGFVSPLTKPWFTDLPDENGVLRKWLMCEVFLWTRQYKEANQVIGKGQSMELDTSNISGYYSGEIFIFTTATLDKLCILGNEYPPCFDGAGFLTQFSKQYISMAEQLENIIGRRYYAMNGKLMDRKESVALNYALELGWPLQDAIYSQLNERGMANYDIEGIFFEGGQIFTIVRNRETTELNRINLIIFNDQTIELETTMIAVEQNWVPVQANAAEPTEPLNGSPSNAAAVIPAAYNAEPAEPVTPVADPVVEPAAAPVVEPPAAEPTTEFTPAATEPAAPVVAPVTDFSEEVATLRTENAGLKLEIEALKAENAAFKKIADTQLVADKEALVAEYAALVEDEESKAAILGLKDTVIDPAVSLEDAEAKLAIEYAKFAKKQKTNESKPDLTFNLNSGDTEENLPEFLVKAMAYDKQYEIKLG